MKIVIMLMCLLVTSVHADSFKVPGPDVDGDGVPDWNNCSLEKDSLKCEGLADPDAIVFNLYYGIFVTFGSVIGDENYDADYDFNNDGIINLADYLSLIDLEWL